MKLRCTGNSLIELLVSIALFSIVATALSTQMVHSTAIVSQNATASQAITFAQTYLESMRMQEYNDMESDAATEEWKEIQFNVVQEVSEDDPAPGTKTIVVTVSWEEKGKTRTYETRTVYSQVQA